MSWWRGCNVFLLTSGFDSACKVEFASSLTRVASDHKLREPDRRQQNLLRASHDPVDLLASEHQLRVGVRTFAK